MKENLIIDTLGSYVCHRCGKPGYKTDGECKVWCKTCLGLLEPVRYPYIRENPKISRNDLCPCGSGLKYKKCCINKK